MKLTTAKFTLQKVHTVEESIKNKDSTPQGAQVMLEAAMTKFEENKVLGLLG